MLSAFEAIQTVACYRLFLGNFLALIVIDRDQAVVLSTYNDRAHNKRYEQQQNCQANFHGLQAQYSPAGLDQKAFFLHFSPYTAQILSINRDRGVWPLFPFPGGCDDRTSSETI